MNAARAGNVTLANFVGNGVADDKAVYPYVPAMIDYYLGETPILGNVETFDLADPDVRDWALERLDQLVWKPVDGSGGKGLVIGPAADDDTLVGYALRSTPTHAVDRAAPDHAVDRADVRRRHDGAAPHRPAAVRVARRQRCLGRPGRADACRAPGGQPRRQFESGRWLEGHVGARRDGGRRGGRRGRRARSRADRAAMLLASRSGPGAATPSTVTQQQQQQQQQQQRHAESHRRVAVLDGPVLRAGRVHRPDPRRVLARAARGPAGRRDDRVPAPARRDGPGASPRSKPSTSRCSLRGSPTTCAIRARSCARSKRCGRTPAARARHLLGDVGEHQHDAPAAAGPARRDPARSRGMRSSRGCGIAPPHWPGSPTRR